MTAEVLLALVAMIAIMAWIIKGARPLRAGRELHARHWSFLRRYDGDRSPWPALVLGSFAMGTLFEAGQFGTSVFGAGIVLGLTCGLLWRFGFDGPANVILAAVCLAASAVVITGLDQDQPSSPTYRYLMVGLLTACYVFGALLGARSSLLSARRAQVYFGIVDVVAFMATPGGADLRDLAFGRHLIYLAVTCGACFLFGLVDVDIVVVLMAAAIAVTELALDPAGSLDEPLVAMTALFFAWLALRFRNSSTTGVTR